MFVFGPAYPKAADDYLADLPAVLVIGTVGGIVVAVAIAIERRVRR
jgi:hypothetical protein